MSSKILLRIASIFPSLIFISILLFFLSKLVPSNSVDQLMATLSSQGSTNMAVYNKKYEQLTKTMGLDKPYFYFGCYPQSYPDTLFRIATDRDKKTYRELVHIYPNADLVAKFLYARNRYVEVTNVTIQEQAPDARIQGYETLRALTEAMEPRAIRLVLERCEENSFLRNENLQLIKLAFNALESDSSNFNFLPKFKWFGTNNQYHSWLMGLISGDFGISLRDGRSVSTKIKEALKWTVMLNGLSLLLSLLLSIGLGTYLGAFASARMDTLFSGLTYALYAIPIFWLATLFIVFFTTPEYGYWTNIFPSVGIFILDSDQGVISQFFKNIGKLILPVLCIVITSVAYMTRQMRASIKEQLQSPYREYLMAKGVDHKDIVMKHVLPNAIFPIITLMSLIIPFLFSGSLVIEYIFNIPGMGRLLMDSILFQDWPVIFVIDLLFAIVTILSFLIADILYFWLDPRLRSQRNLH